MDPASLAAPIDRELEQGAGINAVTNRVSGVLDLVEELDVAET